MNAEYEIDIETRKAIGNNSKDNISGEKPKAIGYARKESGPISFYEGSTGYRPADPKLSNTTGAIGFGLSMAGLFLGWIPVIGWLIWLAGLLFSIFGVVKKPRTMGIIGICISTLSGILFLATGIVLIVLAALF